MTLLAESAVYSTKARLRDDAPSQAGTRLVQLDGLRGVAAIVVVVAHVITGFFPTLYFGGTENTDRLLTSPLFVAWSGQFAVSIFFALSGFVIAGSAEHQKSALPVVLVCRYLRLALPMLASAIVAYALIKIWPTSASDAAVLTESQWLATRYIPPAPDLAYAAYEATIGTFMTGNSYFNNPFWTMRYELFGSVAIYIAHRVLPRGGLLALAAVTSIVLLWLPTPWQTLLPMSLGVVIYQLRSRIPILLQRRAIYLMILALFLGGYPYIDAKGPVYQPFSMLFPSNTDDVVRAFGAGLLLWVVLAWEPARAALSTGLAQFFGTISYPLYLLHFPILATALSQARIDLDGSPALFAVAVAGYFAVTVMAAWAFELVVDRPTMRGLSAVRAASSRLGWRLRD